MKYLFLFPELLYRKGGIAVYNLDMLRAFNKTFLADEAIVLTMNDRNNPSEYGFRNNIKIKNCGNFGRFRKIIFVLRAVYYSVRLRPKLIICGHINMGVLCLAIKRTFGLSYMVCAYGIDVWNISKKTHIRALEEALFITSISRYTKDKIMEQTAISAERIILLPNSVDGDKFYPKEKRNNLLKKYDLEESKLILTVCRLSNTEKYKGYDMVINALPAVLMEIPNAKYMIVGDGDDLPRVLRIVKEHGLDHKVIFAGFAPDEDLIDYYNLCDVFVMPSKKEGFGFVFLEALACGKPVVAGDKDGSRDALLDGKLGILVDPDNVDEIADAIIKVLKREVSERLLDGEYLRKRVLEVYGFDRFKERVEALIKGIIQ
jgi:glycosyltransferase involved in cell wall biosynthesis